MPKGRFYFNITGMLLLVFLMLPEGADAQNKQAQNEQVLRSSFSAYDWQPPAKRKVLSLRNKKLIYKINPVTYVSAGALFVYQNVISQQIQANCNYEISCSEFTKRSIEEHGFIKGLLTGLNQLTNCAPSVLDDHCEYVISKNLKIINSIED
jgi:putative component of membrane protein insertase Oxa1/YidC/SpoIIIJ protein YidD